MINASQPAIPRRARTAARATGRLPAELSTTIRRRLRGRREEGQVDARRDEREGAGEALVRPGERLLARREQRVDPRQQAVALVAARRVPEPLRVDERRRRGRLRLEQRDVREPRHGRVEAVDDVEVPATERRRDVRADTDRDPHRRTRRDRHRARDGDDAVELAALEGATARDQIGRPRGRREHDHAVPASAERLRDAGHVLVRVVRHGPRVRGHEADAERHGRRIVGRAVRSPRGRGHDHRPRERALQDRRAGHDRRRGGRAVRDPGGEGDRALPLWALADEAVLRRLAPSGRVRGRGARGRPAPG